MFRWVSYFYQIRFAIDLEAQSVLEIGPGNGWTVDILRDMGIEVKTVDTSPHVSPDYIASVEELPLPDNSFDMVVGYEILEHLPYELFAKALTEMARVSRKYVVIGLPDQRRTLINFRLKLLGIPEIHLFIKIPRMTSKPLSIDGHYWEIGLNGYPPKKIKETIREAGLTLKESFVARDGPTSHYFVISK